MKKEITATGKTLDEAIANAKIAIGKDSEDMEYEILEFPKKGILGIGAAPAVIKVTYTVEEENPALGFVKMVVDSLELDARVTNTVGEEGELKISIDGDDAGNLIGHHGETLDALQYLASLAACKKEKETGEKSEYTRISVDAESYRVKREETLRGVARRMAARVLKYKRNITLEPMNPYERRIIHSEIQNIEGVTTYSVGVDAERRIVIAIDRKNRNEEKE